MLLEEILSKTNMQLAYKRVTGNKGAAGVDGIAAADFAGQLKAEWEAVKAKLEAGTYLPQAVKRVTIPKPNGGERKLGIPKLLSYYFIAVNCRNVFAITNYYCPVKTVKNKNNEFWVYRACFRL
jgi:RNA-directed DNA polymerase